MATYKYYLLAKFYQLAFYKDEILSQDFFHSEKPIFQSQKAYLL